MVKYFHGVEVSRHKQGIYLNQRKYILDLLKDTGLLGCNLAPTPMCKGTKLTLEGGSLLSNAQTYRNLVGRLCIWDIQG